MAPNEAASSTQEQEKPAEVGSGYDVVRQRLIVQAKELASRANTLNAARQTAFGTTPISVLGSERVRTENNCVPSDIVMVGGSLLFGYNVYLGLRTETVVSDVFGLHRFAQREDGSFDLENLQGSEQYSAILADPKFLEQFGELYRYYKHARLRRLWRSETHLLAVFQTGVNITDVRVFRWALFPDGRATFVDNRGERDLKFPPPHDFEWTATTREDHVRGRHPHVSIRDRIFVETIGGDLTIKVENNTEFGTGIYAEPVDESNQSLDDAQIEYAEVGSLILLKVLPYRENRWRYLVYVSRAETVHRVDAMGESCAQLPEDHGIIFPGGYVLQDGTCKVFDGNYRGFVFERVVKSPNGEDVLYVFHHESEGKYALFAYNLIRKEVASPIACNGYSLFDDGKVVVFRANSEEPVRVHPMQFWQTPFVSPEFAAAREPEAVQKAGAMGRVGNAELVRGISDALSIKRMVDQQAPTRQVYEDLISAIIRTQDSYYWIGEAEFGNLAQCLHELRHTAELIVDEFDKVVAIRSRAKQAVSEAADQQAQLLNRIRRAGARKVATDHMEALHQLRRQRGHVISLRELRYVDLTRLDALEQEVVQAFDEVSREAVRFLLDPNSLAPMRTQVDTLIQDAERVTKLVALEPLETRLSDVSEGMSLLSEIVAGLKVDDPTQRTEILERLSEVFAHVNRGRATLEAKRRSLRSAEGRAEFAAQFTLLGQSVSSELSASTTPDACDDALSKVLVLLEELESKFSEFDEFLGDLAAKREEILEAFTAKKQLLVDERQRRAEKLFGAGERILQGVLRRSSGFKDEDELQAYFASDPMVLKIGDLATQLDELSDSVRAEELRSKIKSARQDSLRGLRDRRDLYADGGKSIKLGRHAFSVNTQPLELGLLPSGEQDVVITLAGTDFRETVTDPDFLQTRRFWPFPLISENDDVYRGEYLAATIFFAAIDGRSELTLDHLLSASRNGIEALGQLVKKASADRYDEGYERGCHDLDATKILSALLSLDEGAGILRYSAKERSLALIAWEFGVDDASRLSWTLRARSMSRLRRHGASRSGQERLSQELGEVLGQAAHRVGLSVEKNSLRSMGRYLAEELGADAPVYTISKGASDLRHAFEEALQNAGSRHALDEELASLAEMPAVQLELLQSWIGGFVETGILKAGVAAPLGEASGSTHRITDAQILEAAGFWILGSMLRWQESSATLEQRVDGLLGQHRRIDGQSLTIRLDEFMARLRTHCDHWVPDYRRYRSMRHELLTTARSRLRLDEFATKVLSSFVRNRLINEVYLPLVGDNLAKQMGALGADKRTDLMGLLLLISPPGYGKTTLMEYIASRLGLVFVKVNGPSLGHEVSSLDPAQAPNATARQEVEKVNLALEMGNNVMLYLDDIQHTHPEFLQKFISLCDAQRRIEGVWKGKTRTYDLRGKKFCVVMAGNPYTETGEKFRIPDMLANRADTYNLGDILSGAEDVFSLSYLENAVTSNSVLAPLATRGQADLYRFVELAQGAESPSSEFEFSYSAAESEEIVAVLRRMLTVQKVVLAVNQEYIRSAGVDDNFRTEPSFKLQGSYRNMNKLAEKIVAAMNEDELQNLILDHYTGEAQTLTTGAESNLLKLAVLCGRTTEKQAARWDAICNDFRRRQRLGGAQDDPAVRISAQLADVGEHLATMGSVLRTSGERDAGADKVVAELAELRGAFSAVARSVQTSAPKSSWSEELGPRLDAIQASLMATLKRSNAPVGVSNAAAAPSGSGIGVAELAPYLSRLDEALSRLADTQFAVTMESPPEMQQMLAQQISIVERTLIPMVRAATQKLEDSQRLERTIRELLAQLYSDARAEEGQARR